MRPTVALLIIHRLAHQIARLPAEISATDGDVEKLCSDPATAIPLVVDDEEPRLSLGKLLFARPLVLDAARVMDWLTVKP